MTRVLLLIALAQMVPAAASRVQIVFNCTQNLTPTSQNVVSGGASHSVTISGSTNCAWTASENESWITIDSGTPGNGNGTVNYTVSLNSGGERVGVITVGSRSLTVTQAAAGGASDLLDDDRKTDWSLAGATVTHRTTQCGSTIAAYTGAATTINNALSACASGQFVQLGSGTFTINSGAICMVSNVTLRGMGADSTKIVSTGSGSCNASYNASIIFAGASGLYPPTPANSANWTAGYAKGATSITVSSTTNLQVGSIIMLDQLDDTDTPTNDLWVCKNAGVCSHDGAVAFLRTDRNQADAVRVAGISGSTVTLERGLHMPNWRTGRTPGAYWSSSLPLIAAGLEDISLDVGGNGQQHGLVTENAYGWWILRSRILDGNFTSPKRCVMCSFAASAKSTTRSNYFYGSRGAVAAAGTYGYELRGASDNLHENNIWEDNTAPFIQGQGSQNNVFAYNYAISGWYVSGGGTWPTDCYPAGAQTLNCTWMSAAGRYHAIGNNYTLFEGNEGNGFAADALRGTSFFGTSFRSYWHGWDAQGGANTGAGKTQQTVAVYLYAYNRYFAFIGNVLGESGVHSTYQCSNATTTDACASGDTTVFVLGYSGNAEYRAPVPNDARVKDTLYRWGNYDIVSAAARFESSEVPTGDAFFPQAVPSSQTLPASLYLAAKPGWFGAIVWPPIGPDVSGTLGPGNKVIKIPSRQCYEALADDSGYSGNNTVRVFTPGTCYP